MKTTKADFIVEQHQASPLHFNFRMLIGKHFKSWAIPKGPSMNPREQRLAIEMEDSIQENAPVLENQFTLWDKGTYRSLQVESQFRKGTISFILFGSKLRGAFSLIKTKSNQWLLMKRTTAK